MRRGTLPSGAPHDAPRPARPGPARRPRAGAVVRPHVLPPNVLRHFYAGGARIAALRGLELQSDRMPEEWIGAVNTAFGSQDRGLSRLEDGRLVRDAIAADPEAYLGAEH